MRPSPFGDPGQFWRGNLHTHSTESDGTLSPESLIEAYRAAGYDFLAITDHFGRSEWGAWQRDRITDATRWSTPDFVTIPSAEAHAPRTRLGRLFHIGAIGLPLDVDSVSEVETGSTLTARAHDAGAFVIAYHPAWYGLTANEIAELGHVHAVEVFNVTTMEDNDRGDSWVILDQLLAAGHRFNAVATDDAHFFPEYTDGMRAWVWVRATQLSPHSIVDALKRGAYYSTTGPMIEDIDLEGGRLIVRCSPAAAVFVAEPGGNALAVRGTEVREAVFDVTSLAGTVIRVTVRDHAGQRAWTNPIWP